MSLASIIATEQIYDTIFDDDAFANLPTLISRTFEGTSSALGWQQEDGSPDIAHHNGYYPDSAVIDYSENFVHADPWMPIATRPGNLGKPTFMSDELDLPSLRETKFYNEWMRNLGDDSLHCMTAVVATPYGNGVFNVLRGASPDSAFTTNDTALFGYALPHLTRSLTIRSKLAIEARQKECIEAALDAAGYAMIAVDSVGRIHMTNIAGEALLQSGALRSRAYGGLLVPSSEMAAAIAVATRSSAPVATSVRVPLADGKSCVAQVTPFAAPTGRRTALLLIREQADQTTRGDSLRQLYGLTAAEVDVALMLTHGLPVASIAAGRGTSLETTRSQLRSIRQKTNCKRQAELVTLVSNLPG